VPSIKSRGLVDAGNRRYGTSKLWTRSHSSPQATTETTIPTCLRCTTTKSPKSSSLFLLCDTCGTCLCQSCFYHDPNGGPLHMHAQEEGHPVSKVRALPTTTVEQITAPTIIHNDPYKSNDHVQQRSMCNTMICSQCRMFDSITARMLPLRQLPSHHLDGGAD
jgi:hypothetical protein